MCVLHPCQYRVQISAQGGGSETEAGSGDAAESDYPSTTRASYGRWQLPHPLLFLCPAHSSFLPTLLFPNTIDMLRRDTDTSCRTPQEPAGAVTECAVVQASQQGSRRVGCVFSQLIEGELHVELLFFVCS